MKNLNKIVFGLCLALFVGCSGPQTTEQSVVVDITDPHHLSDLMIGEVLSGFQLDRDIWDGATFNLATVTDIWYNSGSTISIDPETPWFGSKPDRKERVQEFYRAVEQTIAELECASQERPQSSVWITIAQELERLSRSKAGQRRAIVYSDLHEHTRYFSLYRTEQFELLETNPNMVLEILTAQKNLPSSLSGIEVHLVWTPTTADAAYRFHRMAEFYKAVLEERGAKVMISGSLKLTASEGGELRILKAQTPIPAKGGDGGTTIGAVTDTTGTTIGTGNTTTVTVGDAEEVGQAGLDALIELLGALIPFFLGSVLLLLLIDRLIKRIQRRIYAIFLKAVQHVLEDANTVTEK